MNLSQFLAVCNALSVRQSQAEPYHRFAQYVQLYLQNVIHCVTELTDIMIRIVLHLL